MSTTQWREIPDPVSGVLELLNLLFWNVHHSQQVVLELYSFLSFWELGRVAVGFQFRSQLLGCRADWHSCAMETEGEQNIIAVQSFVPGIEVAFCH